MFTKIRTFDEIVITSYLSWLHCQSLRTLDSLEHETPDPVFVMSITEYRQHLPLMELLDLPEYELESRGSFAYSSSLIRDRLGVSHVNINLIFDDDNVPFFYVR